MQHIIDGIYREVKSAHEEAKFIERMWHIEIARRELSRRDRGVYGDERTNYNFRVVIQSSSFSCIWERVQFVKRGRKTVRVVTKIPMQESGKLKITHFKHAEDWELKLIKEMEESLVKIRLTVRQLMKSHVSIVKLVQLTGLEINPLKGKDYLTPSVSSVKLEKERISK